MSSRVKSAKVALFAWLIMGLAVCVLAWQMMSSIYGPLLVATPAETIRSIVTIATSPEAVVDLYRTLARVIIALGIQIIASLTLGMIAGFYPWVEAMLRPITGLLTAIPPVALALVVIFVFGGGERQVVATAVALGLPLLYGGTIKAVRSVDRDLLEMMRAFRVPWSSQLCAGYIPATLYSLLPNVLLAAGLTVRLMIMAEVIVGVERGIGQAIGTARAHMATGVIFAWMLIMAATVLLVEGILLYLVKNHVLAWQARR